MSRCALPQARMPAEWEAHSATHLAWPGNRNDWPGKFSAVRWAFVEIVRHIAHHEPVRLAVNTARQEHEARRMLTEAHVDMAAITFDMCPLNRGWMRDISPCYVVDKNNNSVAVRFRFNGWAKYDDYQRDAMWPEVIAPRLGLPLLNAVYRDREIVLEGGAIDVNGCGALLTTEECLLDATCQVRNTGFTKKDYEACFRRYLGVDRVIWLGAGIAGDDTHGHVDDICRFVDAGTVVACREMNRQDDNHAALAENLERLQGTRLADNTSLDVVTLPMPAPLFFKGLRLPASYANFYILNGAVLVPTFNDPNDRVALGILGELFSDRQVIGIHAVDLVWGFGTLHCLSHEEPAAVPRHTACA